jgi:hypothetical protein
MNHFYITLPSDSSGKYFPDNTVAHFTSRLPHRIRLDGDYEIGLAEIIYPYSWFNFINEADELHTHFVKTDSGEIFAMCSFPSGQYASEMLLTKGLNDKLTEVCSLSCNRKDLRVIFKYDEVFRKMTFTVRCDDDSEGLFISEDLRMMFGFAHCGPYRTGEYTAEKTYRVNDGTQLLYLYCDVAAFTAVGHEKAPLLRVCNTKGKYGDTIRTIFTHPHYVPLARREIESIEINIKTELGKPTPFAFGKSVVTLHFRRRHSLLSRS